MNFNNEYYAQMATEKGMSSLEVYLRKMPVEVCSVFLNSQGNLVPAAFQETEQKLVTQDTATIAGEFVNTIRAHQNIVLAAVNANGKKPLFENKRVLVLFSGGPAAGGNNVIVGLYKMLGKNNKLLGVKSGPGGLLKGNTFEITEQHIKHIINMGGFDFLGSDRTKIEGEKQFETVKKVCHDQNVDAIVVIGGDDSNTNAAFLAEKLFKDVHPDGRGVQVIGVPKTIDGDLQIGDLLPISFGFHTATAIYSETVGNISQDTPSSQKYWHFVRVMGRAASQVALEIAINVRPPITLISEEIAEKNYTLNEVINGIVHTIALRAAKGIKHGSVLIPEGLIEFIPEMKKLINELNMVIDQQKELLTKLTLNEQKEIITEKLSAEGRKTLDTLPEEFENMLLLSRDDHGNLPVSQIETEKLIISLCSLRIKMMQQDPNSYRLFDDFGDEELANFLKYKFSPLSHFIGYEGRCGAPSKFDMAFTLNLGLTAGSLILAGKTGYMVSVTDLDKGGKPLAIPLTGLLAIETRGSKEKIVIKKALVELKSPAFQYLKTYRKKWAEGDYFHSTGPRQYCGTKEITDKMPLITRLNCGYETSVYDIGVETKLLEC